MTRPSGDERWREVARFGAYLAFVAFALSAGAHIYLFNARPRTPSAVFDTPITLQMFGPAETIYTRAWEPRALDALVVIGWFSIAIAVIGMVRLRRFLRTKDKS
jgi:hypothetical protein